MERPSRIFGDQGTITRKAPEEGAFGRRQKSGKEVDYGKRAFLRKFGLAIVASDVALYSIGRDKEKVEKTAGFFKKMLNYYHNRVEKVANDQEKNRIVETEKDALLENERQESLRRTDFLSVRKLVDQESDFGPGTFEVLKNYWVMRYEGDMKKDLDEALVNMKNWEFLAKKEFLSEGELYCSQNELTGQAREDFMKKFKECFYLSIPESHWRLGANSYANAGGPFQFTEETASDYKLEKKDNYDERRDPLKSAKASGKYILALYDEMKHNWDLALSAYNGSFARKFLGETKKNPQEFSYPKFLEYLGRRIKQTKQEIFSDQGKMLTHKVINGDNWKKISKLYGPTEDQLRSMNGIKKEKPENVIPLKDYEKIFVSPTPENRQKNFYHHIEGYAQNINYPAKLYAVLAILEKRKIETGRDPLNQGLQLPGYRNYLVKQIFGHTIVKKDTLKSLAKKYEVSEEDICEENGLKKNAKIILGKELTIRTKKTLATLAPFGRFDVIRKLNPAIIDPEKPLPDGIMIRSHVALEGEKDKQKKSK